LPELKLDHDDILHATGDTHAIDQGAGKDIRVVLDPAGEITIITALVICISIVAISGVIGEEMWLLIVILVSADFPAGFQGLKFRVIVVLDAELEIE
jgi:hypothetical protein